MLSCQDSWSLWYGNQNRLVMQFLVASYHNLTMLLLTNNISYWCNYYVGGIFVSLSMRLITLYFYKNFKTIFRDSHLWWVPCVHRRHISNEFSKSLNRVVIHLSVIVMFHCIQWCNLYIFKRSLKFGYFSAGTWVLWPFWSCDVKRSFIHQYHPFSCGDYVAWQFISHSLSWLMHHLASWCHPFLESHIWSKVINGHQVIMVLFYQHVFA